eukprot:TRINITY_DN42450_c0_g1_i1.p1 TRINITY_DN42450_c0_g1~~TRINITY_DN42450_c0_g1_i1.p1  ORF type:complete len:456 (+),score=55.04 TRINITY_DN42450_c0_g1_i1:85-1452(+)
MRCVLLVDSDTTAQVGPRALSIAAFLTLLALVTSSSAAAENDPQAEEKSKGRVSSTTSIWHYVDVPVVVCPGVPHETTATIELSEIPEEERSTPFIFSFYRTSLEGVTVTFKAEGAHIEVIAPDTEVALVDTTSLLLSGEQERRLLDSPSFVGGSRRRSDFAKVGLGGFGGAKPRVGNFLNPYHPFLAYKYSSSMTGISSMFLHGYGEADYGIAGVMKRGNDTEVLVALPSVGTVKGSRTTLEKLERWRSMVGGDFGKTCAAGSWQGDCSDCLNRFDPVSCFTLFNLPQVWTRDDILRFGFIPNELAWPVTVTISNVTGADFSMGKICDRDGNATTEQESSLVRNRHSLFVTITKVRATDPPTASIKGAMWHGIAILSAIALCSVCCFLRLLWKAMSLSQEDETEEEGGQPELLRANTAELRPLMSCTKLCSCNNKNEEFASEEMQREPPAVGIP